VYFVRSQGRFFTHGTAFLHGVWCVMCVCVMWVYGGVQYDGVCV